MMSLFKKRKKEEVAKAMVQLVKKATEDGKYLTIDDLLSDDSQRVSLENLTQDSKG